LAERAKDVEAGSNDKKSDKQGFTIGTDGKVRNKSTTDVEVQ
jgi:hypothetical protein